MVKATCIMRHFFFLYKFIYFNWRLITLQYCIGFAVHQRESTTGLILFCPLLLLPSIFPSIGIFFIELALHIRWPKYWSFNFSIIASNSGMISFRIDWLDLLADQGFLKSLIQHSSKASIFWCSAFIWLNSHIHT